MRDSLFFFLNGRPIRVQGQAAFEMLAPYLRREHNLTGTKLACAQGGCGACTILLGHPKADHFEYLPINSCIYPVFGCDGCHVVTIEGINGPDGLHRGADNAVFSPVQNAMVQCHGAQCGFCTPGIVVSLTAFHEGVTAQRPVDEQAITTALEGNLCRCTGYSAIIEAGLSVQASEIRRLADLYPTPLMRTEIPASSCESVSVHVPAMAGRKEQLLFQPRTFEEAVAWKSEHPNATVVAGSTEVGVAINNHNFEPQAILSLARIEGLDEVRVETNEEGQRQLVLGAGTTWSQIAPIAQEHVPEFSLFLQRWGSPQLRNTGTVAGNLVRAAAISDSLPFLLVCEAHIELASAARRRTVAVETFLGAGSGTLDLRPEELVHRVIVPLPNAGEHLSLHKVMKRRIYDRSIVSAAFWTKVSQGNIESIRIAFGGVDRTVFRLHETEAILSGQSVAHLDLKTADEVAQSEINPASDAGASAQYRRQLVTNLFRKWMQELRSAQAAS